MKTNDDKKINNYGKKRKILLLIVRFLSLPFVVGYVIWEGLDGWISRQEQKIEDERVDKVYLEKYGKTYKEYHTE